MAFKIVNDTVIHNSKLGDLSNLTIDTTAVLVGDGAGNVTLQNVIFDGATVDLTPSLTSIDTDDISEGSTNQYFTDAKAQAALAADIASLNLAITTGDDTTETVANAYTDTREVAITAAYQAYTDAAVNTGTSSLDTDDIPEGSLNLYYTDARADARATLRINAATTDNISEGTTNLYYTDARVETYLTTNSFTDETYVDGEIATATTNLQTYADQVETDANTYTDTRETAITTAYQTYADTAEADAVTTANAYTDAEVANVVDSAPAVLDTLNELAAALGDDPSFATTVSNNIGTKVSKSGDTMTGNLSVPTVRITATADASTSSTGHGLQIGPNGGQNLIMDTNEVFARNNGAVDGLHLNADGGDVTINNNLTDKVTFSGGEITASGDITAYSDRALKRNIQTIENALDKVMAMRGVTYQKDEKDGVGVIAQEVEEVLPEVVKKDGYGMRSVAYGNMVGVLIEAIKEQQAQIEELKLKLNEK